MTETIIRIPGKLVADEYGTKLANVSDLDNDVYGPYASVSAAHAALQANGLNIVGTTVGISGNNNTITEYWYQGGTEQANLVKKQSDVTNAPDEEDLTSVNDLLKFKNRNSLNGYGYYILRRGSTIGSQMTLSNTIYEVRYNFDISQENPIEIPSGCILYFNGGSISGAQTLTGNNTGINAELVKIFNTDVTLAGTWNVTEAYPEWFGAKGDGVVDDADAIQKTIDSFKNIYAPNLYLIESELTIIRQYTHFRFNKIVASGCDGISLAGYLFKVFGKELICDDTHSCIKMGYASAEIPMPDIYKYCGSCEISISHLQGGYGIDMYKQQGGHINGVRIFDTWMNGKLYAIRITGNLQDYEKKDLSKFNNNTFDNCSIEASMAGIYVENVTWYSISFNNCRTNEMGLPGRGAAFTFKNCLVANSEIIETQYSSYRTWIIENTTVFEVNVRGIANFSGSCLANKAVIKYDTYARKLVPIFKRTDNQIKTPKIVGTTTVDTNASTLSNYYGIKDFILESNSDVTINFDAPYNYLGFNKLTFLVPNITEQCLLKIKTNDGNYNPTGVTIPKTFEPTIYDVFLTGNQKGYYKESKFNGDADIIDTTLLTLPRTENTIYYVNSEHSNTLFKKVYAKIILDKVVFGNPASQFLEVCKADGTILMVISPASYSIDTGETTRTIIAELPNNNSFAYIRLVVYGYSNPSAGKIQVRVRGILNV